jgi:hypothetical protein
MQRVAARRLGKNVELPTCYTTEHLLCRRQWRDGETMAKTADAHEWRSTDREIFPFLELRKFPFLALRKFSFLDVRKFLSKTVAELANSFSLGRYCDGGAGMGI